MKTARHVSGETSSMNLVALDIGGANLKASDGLGWARSMPFPLWRDPEGLAGALNALLRDAPSADQFAVTMTGELCDCFDSKEAGVRHILKAVEAVAGTREVAVYLVDGRLVSCEEATAVSMLAAASNWHALARFVWRFLNGGPGLLIDVGSTTTDIIPLLNREVAARGRTDFDRLTRGELVYTGVGRTPVCAVVRSLPVGGGDCPVAGELFATTADAYVLSGEIGEERAARWTADGRALTKQFARQRLARMVCTDASELSDEDFGRMAAAIHNVQCEQLRSAIEPVMGKLGDQPTVILSGAGEFLARAALHGLVGPQQVVSLTERLGGELSRCAPAHALAVIARETAEFRSLSPSE
jgi:probable H4MPT-linked C1 transfer pathway protein